MKSSIAIALALILSACASQNTQPSYYLLRPDATLKSAALTPSTAFSMGNIYIAPYIDQPGLLLEVAPGEVRAARNHLWAEPVRDGINTFLTQEISRTSGENLLPAGFAGDTTRINIRIDQLHGTGDGHARLVAYWWLSEEGLLTSTNRFAESMPLETAGYAALAAAEKKLLAQLAAAISDSIVNEVSDKKPIEPPVQAMHDPVTEAEE